MTSLSDSEFAQFRQLIFDKAGISLSDSKKALVGGRLAGRLAHHGLGSYREYLQVLRHVDAADELQLAVDLLTTNETYFFREPKHFEFLRKQIAAMTPLAGPLRIWSAAGSSGEEAYSIAMLLEDLLPAQPWEILCSDISKRMLDRARRGHYSTARLENLPRGYLQRFCLKGTGEHEGTLLVNRALRNRISFLQINLNTHLPDIGVFDVVFLRNVMIYFSPTTKREVVGRVYAAVRRGGYLFIGHSENLAGVSDQFELIAPAIFRRPP
jgi:chemotaxis protein methyltransferase CheR